MSHELNTQPDGKVYLIGAGPGAADLITVKGLRYLRRADVVLYDRLVSQDLLDELRPGTELVYVGKEPNCHTLPQAEINRLLISYAQRGLVVARLKGGDPFLFGRGGEEALALKGAGIPFEVVPGVSSALAVPASAGIPVTHRGYASSVTIVTGQEGHAHSEPGVDWEVLAHTGGTLVILMGVKALPEITRRLRDAGLDPATPASVIQEGTTERQRVVSGTVADIAELALSARLHSPSITVIGAVAAMSEILSWSKSQLTQQQATAGGVQEATCV